METEEKSLPIADVHSHILPGIDDGSKSVEESLELLRMLKNQNVVCVAATPHFYSNRVQIDEFLRKRKEAFLSLQSVWTPDLPEIRLGAEVSYFSGISHSEAILNLKIEGTPLLLVEMPFAPWTQRMVEELIELNNSGKARVLLAHVERYFAFVRPATWETLLQNGVLMQSNADYFCTWLGRRRGVRMFRQGRFHVLGTDCHNTDTRPPRLDEVKEKLLDSGAEDVVRELNRFYRYFFERKEEKV